MSNRGWMDSHQHWRFVHYREFLRIYLTTDVYFDDNLEGVCRKCPSYLGDSYQNPWSENPGANQHSPCGTIELHGFLWEAYQNGPDAAAGVPWDAKQIIKKWQSGSRVYFETLSLHANSCIWVQDIYIYICMYVYVWQMSGMCLFLHHPTWGLSNDAFHLPLDIWGSIVSRRSRRAEVPKQFDPQHSWSAQE